MGIFARLGHVLFFLGILISGLLILLLFGGTLWFLWDTRGQWWPLLTGLRVVALVEWLWRPALGVVIFLIVALIPLLIGLALCYILGGFTDQADRP